MASIRPALLTLALTICLLACQQADTSSMTPSSVKAQKIEPTSVASAANMAASQATLLIELSSPDQAVKTWWRFIDMKALADMNTCLKEVANAPSTYLAYLPSIAQSDVLRTFTLDPTMCSIDVYSRDIQEVKMESETRALVFALIKNISPPPLGADPDEHDSKSRQDGSRFKYVLEKTSQGWKVSQVFKYSDINHQINENIRGFSKRGKLDVWESVYRRSDKPRYPSYVFDQ